MKTFKTELTKAIKATIAHLDRSTVGVSRDCLWQLTASRISRECPNAPRGTNAAWVARQTFDEIVSAKPFNKFVYE
jgi:hypothetical protein